MVQGKQGLELGHGQDIRCELRVLLLSAGAELLPSPAGKGWGAGWRTGLREQQRAQLLCTHLCAAAAGSGKDRGKCMFLLAQPFLPA